MEEGEEVTLMGWGNAIFRKLHRDAASGAVTAIDAGERGGGPSWSDLVAEEGPEACPLGLALAAEFLSGPGP